MTGASAPAPSVRTPRTQKTGAPAPAVAGAGRENRAPENWPFPLWNGQKVPRPKVARQMPRELWEEAPF